MIELVFKPTHSVIIIATTIITFCFSFFKTCRPGCLRTPYVDQIGLELIAICLCLPNSGVTDFYFILFFFSFR